MSEPKHGPNWMRGYYIGFDETGCMPVDVILSAVARAGKAYHHTDQWHEECTPYEPDIHRGNSCCDWIQNAGNDAAAIFEQLRKEAVSLLREIRDHNHGSLQWTRAVDDFLSEWETRRTAQSREPCSKCKGGFMELCSYCDGFGVEP